MKAKT